MTTKKIIKRSSTTICLIFATCLAFISSCNSPQDFESKSQITVTVMPQKYIAEKIAGNLFTIHVMIPPDANPHHFDPTPRQIRDLANSKLYFKIGYIDFELAWINKLEREYPSIRFIDTSNDVELMDDQNSECGHLHGHIEPHLWSSPRNMKIIAANMADAFIQYDPENKNIYLDNLNLLNHELDSLDRYISEKLSNLRVRAFLIYHPSLTYFARDYGLQQIAIENEGKESSVKHFRSIVTLAREKEIRVIFVQQQFNRDEAITLEKEINGKIISIDPLAYEWRDQMALITDQLAEYLK